MKWGFGSSDSKATGANVGGGVYTSNNASSVTAGQRKANVTKIVPLAFDKIKKLSKISIGVR